LERVNYIARHDGRLTVTGAPEGYDAWLAAAAATSRAGLVVLVVQDGVKAASAADTIAFFAPKVAVLNFPAWDCLPYDRMSPSPDIESRRLATLAVLARRNKDSGPAVVVTTVNAILQLVPPREVIAGSSFAAKIGDNVSHDRLARYLAANGYSRASTVREPGDFAVRGGIVDLWPPGTEPLRLDFFGDRLDAIRTFDAETQLSSGDVPAVELLPASEVPLDEAGITRFRTGYVAAFGPAVDDPLYESVSAARKTPGMEHWLPLFHERLETLFDYTPRALILLAPQTEDARKARGELVADYYQSRREFLGAEPGKKGALKAPPYKPLKPETLYLPAAAWEAALKHHPVRDLSPFQAPEHMTSVDAHGRLGRDFAPERTQAQVNVFKAAGDHIAALMVEKKRVIVAAWTEGSAERMGGVLADHGVTAIRPVADWADAAAMAPGAVGLAVLGIEHGFEAPGLAVIAEQDILGDRMVSHRRAKKAQNFLTEAAGLVPGDLVTHIEHGVGRYVGLKAIDVSGAPHDCLELQYDGGKLFLPVENIELLTRYGAEDDAASLDRLGGAGWQQRKAKARERVREIAGELIAIAAARELKTLPEIEKPQGIWDEFCARFPYQETEDQEKAIADAVEDLASGRPMDRLVCGDVGFGKTEVALRTAFVTAMNGSQVAVVVPTTLLARQHYRTFAERFNGFPIKVRQLSRFVDAKEARETKELLKKGDVDIVIGTHALLAKNIEFADLALVIVDEEQHFGVAHKERLKGLKADVHVLTLTATPIPRTLQLALSGVRDLSLITTPPIDRLAVRTFVTPFDPMVIREALLREHYRGGQSFYVCPRISDLHEAEAFLKENVPEVTAAVAHGQMSPSMLEDVMAAFYDRRVQVLISTNIVESGLDIPTANTLVVHRADMFGLSQLYQLRGRIGRSKQRAYAYLTTPADHGISETATRRLEVLQSLDQLGAGFTVASHDMDIRGAGNLLGEEQSGHVKEVGIELYQEMLEEAVSQLRAGGSAEAAEEEQWSPAINIGAAVLIPEAYVPDLNVRMALYRRLAGIETRADMDRFAAEMIDRFGPLPEEVNHLFEIVAIKALCRKAGVASIDAGPKGGVIGFRGNIFSNPIGLVKLINEHSGTVRVRPDQKIVVQRRWDDADTRLKGVRGVLTALANLVDEGEKK
jgi:transcription-repair coupling factor (superfamily II helicase)